jgi:hypothetical protein
MKHLTLWLTVAALLTFGACNKKSENPPPGPASGAMTPPVTAPPSGPPPSAGSAAAGSAAAMGDTAGSATATAAVDVPAEMDFEDEAAKKITDKNVESQVKAIEAELQQK